MFNKVTDIFMNGFLSAGEVVLKNIDKLSFQACLLVGFVALILSIFRTKHLKIFELLYIL